MPPRSHDFDLGLAHGSGGNKRTCQSHGRGPGEISAGSFHGLLPLPTSGVGDPNSLLSQRLSASSCWFSGLCLVGHPEVGSSSGDCSRAVACRSPNRPAGSVLARSGQINRLSFPWAAFRGSGRSILRDAHISGPFPENDRYDSANQQIDSECCPITGSKGISHDVSAPPGTVPFKQQRFGVP